MHIDIDVDVDVDVDIDTYIMFSSGVIVRDSGVSEVQWLVDVGPGLMQWELPKSKSLGLHSRS